jgi:hypothetical protein
MTTWRLNAMFVLINCGQQIIVQDPLWHIDKERARDKWLKEEAVPYVITCREARTWCMASPAELDAHLKRFKLPIADCPPPVLDYEYVNSGGYKCVEISIAIEWAHVTEFYSKIKLPLPVGKPRETREYLRSFLPPPRKYVQWWNDKESLP